MTALLQRKACGLLVRRGAITAGELGAYLWPNRKTRGMAVQGGGDYAAQMLLGRMRSEGLVRVAHTAGSSRWEITPLGQKFAKRSDADASDVEDAERRYRSHARQVEALRFELNLAEKQLAVLDRARKKAVTTP